MPGRASPHASSNHAAVQARVDQGNALMRAGRPAEAATCYRAALGLRPDDVAAVYNLANALLELGLPAEAEACFAQALAEDPLHAGAWNNRGNALRRLGRLAEAAACYRAALALRPHVPGTLNNLGSALIALRRPEQAEASLRLALTLAPHYAEAANNLGGALLAQDRPTEALAFFERALAYDLQAVQPAIGRAMALLTLGRWREGFAAYEVRWRDPGLIADEPARAAPLWDGGDPAGRRILVHAEQGFGDTLQFIRYVPLLRARGARVILEVPAPLLPLCDGMAESVLAAGSALPAHELRCPLMSLPHRLDTELGCVPSATPYLGGGIAPTWSMRGPGLNVGLAVSGSPEHGEDDLRSIPGWLWSEILAVPATYHLLQPSLRAADQAMVDHPALRHHGERLVDFAATAAVVAALDLVISVDTALAHLAGAMARPVWVLLPLAGDFRWLRGSDTTPWYPTMRLFRQDADRAWPPVLRRVAEALRQVQIQPPSTMNT